MRPIFVFVFLAALTAGAAGRKGVVSGTLDFPPELLPIDLSRDPISLALWPQCEAGRRCSPGGASKSFSGILHAATTTYQISIAAGGLYQVEVSAKYWGDVNGGSGQILADLSASSAAIVNLRLQRSGRLAGKLYKPDGSLLRPDKTRPLSVNVNAVVNNSSGHGLLKEDGSFSVGGLLPGSYTLKITPLKMGSFPYIDSLPLPVVNIAAGQDAYRDVALVNAAKVQVFVATRALPAFAYFMNCPQSGNNIGECPPEEWRVQALERGSLFNQSLISDILLDDASTRAAGFEYAASSGISRCDYRLPAGGVWCVNNLKSPAVFDMHLMRRGGFDAAGYVGARPYFVLLNSKQDIEINGLPSRAAVPVDLTPAVDLSHTSTATFKGTVVGKNIFRAGDSKTLGGGFNGFIRYAPVMSLYDSNNVFKAAGMALPDPVCFSRPGALIAGCTGPAINDCLNQSVADNDFPMFARIFSFCGGLGYEIRGLSTGTYHAVLATPNYPPYAASVAIERSTVTLDVDFDALLPKN